MFLKAFRGFAAYAFVEALVVVCFSSTDNCILLTKGLDTARGLICRHLCNTVFNISEGETEFLRLGRLWSMHCEFICSFFFDMTKTLIDWFYDHCT